MYIHTYICISYTYSDMYIYILCEYIVHTYIHTYIHIIHMYIIIYLRKGIYIYVNTVYSINMYIHVDNVFKNEHEYTVHECTLYKDIM